VCCVDTREKHVQSRKPRTASHLFQIRSTQTTGSPSYGVHYSYVLKILRFTGLKRKTFACAGQLIQATKL